MRDMEAWHAERAEIRAWLFPQCRSLDEFDFWSQLWDDLTDMYDWVEDMEPERWWQVSYADELPIGYIRLP